MRPWTAPSGAVVPAARQRHQLLAGAAEK